VALVEKDLATDLVEMLASDQAPNRLVTALDVAVDAAFL
jgi:hypothetical protein